MKKLRKIADYHILIFYSIMLAVWYSPSIIGYILYLTTSSKVHLVYATSWFILWSSPLTPIWLILLSLSIGANEIRKKVIRDNSWKKDLRKLM